MNDEAVLAWLENLVPAYTGERLSELERFILQQVWEGRKYLEIADRYGCTEGHAKDVGSRLWKLLSKALKQKITKSNCRGILEKCFRKAATISGLRRNIAVVESSNIDFSEIDSFGKNSLEQDFLEQDYLEQNYLKTNYPHPTNTNFLGREKAIFHLQKLEHQGNKIISILGEGGLGKTTLAQQYLHNHGFDLVLEVLMAKETANITAVEYIVDEWLKQDFLAEPGADFGVSLGRLKRQLQQSKLQGRKIGILIDNLEPALNGDGQFVSEHRKYVELLRVLSDVSCQVLTIITSRDRLCEPSLQIEHFRLPGLDKSTWWEYFQNRGLLVDELTLQQVHSAYGGNAKAMGIICGAIREDFDGNMVKYWQVNSENPLAITDLKNLVVSQIERLKILDERAYKLLCRLGCYRYQDVAKVPIEGLTCLLWDVPIEQHQEIITSLRNRSLIECDRGEYWLHPVIRSEAIYRLRNSREWEISNHHAAEYWTNSIDKIYSFEDALMALEAYYHYVEIKEYELAAKVIIKSRNNQWQQYLSLGSSLYRMGWVRPLITAINKLIDEYNFDVYNYQISEVYNILGDLHWISGNIHAAINYQQKTITTVTQALGKTDFNFSKHQLYYLRMLEIDSLLSTGLYQIDLWELTAAAKLFQQVINLAENTDHHRWTEKATVCLALVNSYLGFNDMATKMANTACANIISSNSSLESNILANNILEDNSLKSSAYRNPGRNAYFIQILAQTYVNVGNLQTAKNLFTTALNIAESSHYMQVKAKAINGFAEIARCLQQYDTAIEYHQQAIAIFEQIGAKCDLANVLLQLGLTYQQKSDIKLKQIHLERAMKLFQEMNAIAQVKRVGLYL